MATRQYALPGAPFAVFVNETRTATEMTTPAPVMLNETSSAAPTAGPRVSLIG